MTDGGRPSPTGLLGAFIGILLVAATLRALVTPVGPILGTLEEETGVGPAVLGILTALPVIGFAVVSPLVHSMSGRLGVERTVVLGLALIVGGAVLRSATDSAVTLLAGTTVLSAGVAVGNVLVPVVTKRYFPSRAPDVTGAYMAVQTIVAALAAGLVVPLHAQTGSWQVALGAWGIPGIAALLFWLPRLRTPVERVIRERSVGGSVPRSPWRTAVGWQVAGYFLLQSGVFYLTINWLPSVTVDLGFSEARAGWQVSWLMLVSIAANVAVPRLMNVGGDQRFVAVLLPLLVPLPLVGLVVAPGADLLWVGILGLSSGGSMVLSLSLISLRSADPDAAARLSSMAQTVAYSGVAVVLVLASVIRDVAGPGTHILWLMGALGAGQLLVGLLVGRDRTIARSAQRDRTRREGMDPFG
ncbi:MFS transporter [Georgenia sp. Z1344]|uniref:MFS transporter n=1 Tax=Georgenia sp. Z1344 TaxID=3416706 RepID=UPI003CF7CB3C